MLDSIISVSKVSGMASPASAGDREKVVSKLPGWLRQDLKVRTAQLGTEIQTAVTQGITYWCGLASTPPTVDTSGADSFSTWLPPGQWETFKATASDRKVSIIQALAQAVQLWLQKNPAPTVQRPEIPRRIIVCNQKGGVGKTAITAGTGEAMAEDSNALYPVRISKHFAAALLKDSDGESGDSDSDPLRHRGPARPRTACPPRRLRPAVPPHPATRPRLRCPWTGTASPSTWPVNPTANSGT